MNVQELIALPKGSKDPNNRIPLKGFLRGYVGIYRDYIRVQGPK